jgi:hypothetical protein
MTFIVLQALKNRDNYKIQIYEKIYTVVLQYLQVYGSKKNAT